MTRHEIKNTTGTELTFQNEPNTGPHGGELLPYLGAITRVPIGTSEHVDLPARVVEQIAAQERACPSGPLQIRRLA